MDRALNKLELFRIAFCWNSNFDEKDLIVNFVGWIFILTRRPFTNGDRIQIGKSKKLF